MSVHTANMSHGRSVGVKASKALLGIFAIESTLP